MKTCEACRGTGDETVIVGDNELVQACSVCDGEGEVRDPEDGPTDAELEADAGQAFGDSTGYRAAMRDAGRSHLLR